MFGACHAGRSGPCVLHDATSSGGRTCVTRQLAVAVNLSYLTQILISPPPRRAPGPGLPPGPVSRLGTVRIHVRQRMCARGAPRHGPASSSVGQSVQLELQAAQQAT